jgi:magnesium-transporting ATPase (P-type)
MFSDKTGTLTQNNMEFKKLYVSEGYYEVEEMDDFAKIAKKQWERNEGPLVDIFEKVQAEGTLKRPPRRAKNHIVSLIKFYTCRLVICF